MIRVIIGIVLGGIIIGCKKTIPNTTSKEATCILESDSLLHSCSTFELNLNKGKFHINRDGKYQSYNDRKGKIILDEACALASTHFMEQDNKLILFNFYDCGPEGYNDLVCINSSSCKTEWTINDFWGFTPSFFKIDDDIIIPGHYTISRLNINTGKLIWSLDIGKKYEFSRIEAYSINGDELTLTGATSSLKDPSGWKLVDVVINMTSGKEENLTE